MGVFTVETKITNWQNRFLSEAEHGAEVVCQALVDTGAVELALPAELIERLRLTEVGTIRAETAGGINHIYRIMGIAEVEVQGRTCQVRAMELPRGTQPLLGAVPLEEMELHISPVEMKLLPNPRWPDMPTQPLM